MSVTSFAVAALAAVLLAPAFVHAGQRVIIKHAYQLEREKNVKRTGQSYTALAAALVVYDQCAKERGFSKEKQDFVKRKFIDMAKAYQIAYQDAYMAYVGASPSQALVDDIAATIKAKQQNTVNSTADAIRKKGCREPRLKTIENYVNEVAAQEHAPTAQPTLRELSPEFILKH